MMASVAIALASVQVVTFNIRFGTADDGLNAWPLRKAALIRQLGDLNPDVLGFQEALSGQIAEIQAAHPHLGAIGVGRDDGVAAGEHSPILYRKDRLGVLQSGTFWLSDTPDVIASTTWGNRITRICTYALFQDARTKRSFWVFNAHLDHESQPSREKSAALILRRAKAAAPKAPVIVMGDFNAGESNPAVKSILSGGLADTFRARNPHAKDVGTFTAFDTPQADKIDYIFASPDWSVEDADIVRGKVDGRFTSDHFPVFARLALR